MKITTTVSKLSEGLHKIKEAGGEYTFEPGDTTITGSASIDGVEAEYEFNQGELSIEILDKPFLATDSMIEDEINKFFN